MNTARKERLEIIFDMLDKELHTRTYSDLEDKIYSLEIECDSYQEIVVMMQECKDEKNDENERDYF